MTSKIPEKLRQTILYNAHHRCCMCYREENLQIHHIDGNRNNNTIDNLAVLCKKHHDNAHNPGAFYCKLKPDAIKKYMQDWTSYVERERAENGNVVRIPKNENENQIPPNHTKYELIEDSVEEIKIYDLMSSVFKLLISVFIFYACAYAFSHFELIKNDWSHMVLIFLFATLTFINLPNFRKAYLLCWIIQLKTNAEIYLKPFDKLITLTDDNKYFFYRMQAPCIAPECEGKVMPYIPPEREKHRGLIGLCRTGGVNHAYTYDANGIGERITLDTRPIEQKK